MPYNGSVCHTYFSDSNVFYEALDRESVWTRNEDIVIALKEEMLSTVDPFCKRPALEMLCRYAFPRCDATVIEPLPLCRSVYSVFNKIQWLITCFNTNMRGNVSIQIEKALFRCNECYF